LARFDIARTTLDNMMNVCQQEVDRGGSNTSWYLNLREESYSWLDEVDTSVRMIQGMFSDHRFGDMQLGIKDLYKKSLDFQDYFTKKREEEKLNMDRHKTELDDDSSLDHTEADDDDIVLAALVRTT
jgi:hypothetical protein